MCSFTMILSPHHSLLPVTLKLFLGVRWPWYPPHKNAHCMHSLHLVRAEPQWQQWEQLVVYQFGIRTKERVMLASSVLTPST